MIKRRTFLKASAVVAASTVFKPNLADAAPRSLLSCCLQPHAGQSTDAALAEVEHWAGRKMDAVLDRFPWQTHLVNRFSDSIAHGGRIPILSWFTWGGHRKLAGGTTWANIANGHQDARITSEALALKAAGWPSYFAFHKEPQDDPPLGGAHEWIGAYDRVHAIFDEVGVRTKWIVATYAAAYSRGTAYLDPWLPKNYDLLGIDGYNRNVGGNWRTFEQVMAPGVQVAAAKHKPLFAIEVGCVEGSGSKARWLTSAASYAGRTNMAGLSYNNEGGTGGEPSNFRINTSASSLAAWRSLAHATPFA